MPNQHLFIFTIGPVQSFIAQARKSQDLYAGSHLLSDQISLCINETIRQGHEIVFPFTDETHSSIGVKRHLEKYNRTIPNRFVALLKTDDPVAVRDFGDSLTKLTQEALLETAKQVFKRYLIDSDEHSISEQIADFQEKYWAAIAFDSASHAYSERYKLLEKYLGAVKRVRSFKQFNEQGRKCNVNGLYNVKVYRKSNEESGRNISSIRETKLFNAENHIFGLNDQDNIRLRHLQPGEGLCGISFLKRIYREVGGAYPSTANIALNHLFEDPEVRHVLDRYEQMFQGDADAQLIYDENLTEAYFRKYGIRPKNKLLELQDQLARIKAVAGGKKLKISRHYAVLRFDGDDMGEWLAHAKDVTQHRAISKLLLDFSNEAREIVDANLGKTIYAGGDDFLALINLKNLFKVLAELNARIEVLKNKFPIDLGAKKFSVSYSIYISHYKVPLGKVLELSDDLLKRTKKKLAAGGKDGIGIAFFKKSGTIGEVILKNKQIPLLEKTIPLMLEEAFNPRFIYRFSEEFGNWRGDNELASHNDFESQVQLLESEFIRLMLRGCKNKSRQKEVETMGMQLFEQLTDLDSGPRNYSINFSNLVNSIRILEALNATI